MWHLWQTSNPCFTKFWYLHTKKVFHTICGGKKVIFQRKLLTTRCAHISPSCSNFALKEAATGDSDKFGQEAAKTLLRNFYVDDLLKSTKGAEEAVSLIKNVVQMCAAGGFKLTKFISNHPDVLSAIPEEDRKVGVKDQDLLTGKVPEESSGCFVEY